MVKNGLKPLSIADIEFQKEYLFVEFWLDNRRHLRSLVIMEEISTDDEKNRCILVLKDGKVGTEHPHNFSDFGLIPGKRDNKCRVFENAPENREALQKLVSDPSALGYLLAIGFSERDALEIIRKNTSDPEKKRESER
jgi:hypothetical protein